MAKEKDVVEGATETAPVVTTEATPVVATAPVKVELTIEEQFAKLDERSAAIDAGIKDITDAAATMGIADITTAPPFMKNAYEGLVGQKEGIAKERAAIANKIPMANFIAYQKQLASIFATFGFTEKVSMTVSFDPATNLVEVGGGTAKRAASTGVKKEGGGSSAVRNKKTTINGIEYASASEGLKALRPMLGLPETFGDGNSAVRVLEGLAKNPDYKDKFTLSITEA